MYMYMFYVIRVYALENAELEERFRLTNQIVAFCKLSPSLHEHLDGQHELVTLQVQRRRVNQHATCRSEHIL